VPNDKVLEYCRSLPQRRFTAGEVVLPEGEAAGLLFVLEEGAVEILKRGVQITTISEAGALFGEMAALLGIPHTTTVRATRDASFRVADDPTAFLHANPEIALEVAKLLSRRLQLVTDYLVDLKEQFSDRDDHLGMVDEVLDVLVHHQDAPSEPGSDRHPDPKLE
jgi:CRP/FNR family transcriptional regulator, cyclic AMP receptor protein